MSGNPISPKNHASDFTVTDSYDSNNDGVTDTYYLDTDGDGEGDVRVSDADGDGYAEHRGYTTGEGDSINYRTYDKDADGRADQTSFSGDAAQPTDAQVAASNASLDDISGRTSSSTSGDASTTTSTSSNGPTVVEYEDGDTTDRVALDTDGDGKADTRLSDTDGDGKADVWTFRTEDGDLVSGTASNGTRGDQSGLNPTQREILDDRSFPTGDSSATSGAAAADTSSDDVLDAENATVIGQEDADGDGRIDTVAIDLDNDGEIDAMAVDTNADGRIDELHLDSDGDGVAETLYSDENHDGNVDRVDVDVDLDGRSDAAAFDHDFDGNPDEVQWDSDGDGQFDQRQDWDDFAAENGIDDSGADRDTELT